MSQFSVSSLFTWKNKAPSPLPKAASQGDVAAGDLATQQPLSSSWFGALDTKLHCDGVSTALGSVRLRNFDAKRPVRNLRWASAGFAGLVLAGVRNLPVVSADLNAKQFGFHADNNLKCALMTTQHLYEVINESLKSEAFGVALSEEPPSLSHEELMQIHFPLSLFLQRAASFLIKVQVISVGAVLVGVGVLKCASYFKSENHILAAPIIQALDHVGQQHLVNQIVGDQPAENPNSHKRLCTASEAG